jgi:hypothetical protein
LKNLGPHFQNPFSVHIASNLKELDNLKRDGNGVGNGLMQINTTETQPNATTKRVRCCPNAQTVTGQFELTKFHAYHKKSD